MKAQERVPSVLAASVLGSALTACSLTVPNADSCEGNRECRESFGWGSTCGTDGFCTPVLRHERCSRTFPEDLFDAPDEYREHVVIGGLYSYGDHLDTLQGSELALRTVQSSDAFELPFAWVVCDYTEGDDIDDIEATRQTSEYLADVLGVPAIVGPRGSTRTQAAFETVSDTGTLVISPSATSPALIGIDEPNPTDEKPGLLWRTAPPDSLQSLVIASDLRERGITSIAIIAQEGVYGDSLAALLQAEFLALGGTDVLLDTFDADLFDAIADVAATEVEEVVFISSDLADYVAFLGGAVASDNLRERFDAKGLFLPDAAFAESLLADTVATSEVLFDNIRGSRPSSASGPLFDGFAAALSDEFGANASSSGFTAHAFDATWLILYGVVWAYTQEGGRDGIDGLNIARGLRRVSSGPPVEIRLRGWEEVVAHFSAGESIDVTGASGSLDYDPAVEETTAPIEVWTVVVDAESASGYGFERDYVVEP